MCGLQKLIKQRFETKQNKNNNNNKSKFSDGSHLKCDFLETYYFYHHYSNFSCDFESDGYNKPVKLERGGHLAELQNVAKAASENMPAALGSLRISPSSLSLEYELKLFIVLRL